VDVRVISATNRDIEREVQEKRFREDLYYRLNVVQIKNPPLRDRKTDLVLLAQHFLEYFRKQQARHTLEFSAQTLLVIKTHSWPGNIRELKNAVERAVIMCEGPMISVEDLPFFVAEKETASFNNLNLKEAVHGFKKKHLIRTLQSVQGNRTKAAKILKIQRTYLSRLISELDIKGI
jgi:Nif-specific regulatory protein